MTGEIKPAKQPHYFHLPGDRMFSFAGVMATWKAPDTDAPLGSCAVLTQDAVGPAAEVHDRMPLVLTGDSQDACLDPQVIDAEKMIAMARAHAVTTELEHHPVSSRVNAAANDDEVLTKAVTDVTS